jgi:hypothetical protein
VKNKLIRPFLAFIILALAQLACGSSVVETLHVHFYQDLNANAKQDAGEPDFPGVTGKIFDFGIANVISKISDAQGNYEYSNNTSLCESLSTRFDTPAGYRITQNNTVPAEWDFSPLLGTANKCPLLIKNVEQTQNQTVGLAPLFQMTKAANPTTFSGAGQTISYQYIITNPTNGDLSNVAVTDDKTTVTCPAPTVAAGASMTCNSTYTSTEQDASQGSITNKAHFTATFGSSNVTTGFTSATVTFGQPQPAPVAPSPVLTTSVLTGEVITLCDTVNRPLNLRLVSGTDPALVTQELANGNLRILIAGRDISSTCKINLSNTSLLTCTYPDGITSLPAQSQVIYKSTVLKTFNFDGENGCTVPPSDNGGGLVPACDPHIDPTCPLDCTNPANADLCG